MADACQQVSAARVSQVGSVASADALFRTRSDNMELRKSALFRGKSLPTPSSSQEFESRLRWSAPDHSYGFQQQSSTAAMHSSKMALHDLSAIPDEDFDDRHVIDRDESTDGRNPQNWSARKKRLLFLALMSSSILCDG